MADFNQQLLSAAEQGNLAEVQNLITREANVNTINRYNDTPLHMAAENGHLPIVEYLIQLGANVNAVNYWDATPLRFAAENGHLPVVEYLVQAGANVNADDKRGETPLHYTAYYGHLSVVKYLLDSGADRTILNVEDQTAADLAKTDEIREMILTRPGPFWSPNIHSWRTTLEEKAQIRELMLIRNQSDQALSQIPRELMFEIFGHLVQ